MKLVISKQGFRKINEMERMFDDLFEIVCAFGMIILMPLFIVCWAVDRSTRRKMEQEEGWKDQNL